jgi:hypothetical protein
MKSNGQNNQLSTLPTSISTFSMKKKPDVWSMPIPPRKSRYCRVISKRARSDGTELSLLIRAHEIRKKQSPFSDKQTTI